MGSGGVGKSAITVQYTSGLFCMLYFSFWDSTRRINNYNNFFHSLIHFLVRKYDPTIEETYNKPVEVDSMNYILEILGTNGEITN